MKVKIHIYKYVWTKVEKQLLPEFFRYFNRNIIESYKFKIYQFIIKYGRKKHAEKIIKLIK